MEVGGWLRGGGGGEAPRARLCWVEPDGERGFHGRVASRKEEKRERQTLSLSLFPLDRFSIVSIEGPPLSAAKRVRCN